MDNPIDVELHQRGRQRPTVRIGPYPSSHAAGAAAEAWRALWREQGLQGVSATITGHNPAKTSLRPLPAGVTADELAVLMDAEGRPTWPTLYDQLHVAVGERSARARWNGALRLADGEDSPHWPRKHPSAAC